MAWDLEGLVSIVEKYMGDNPSERTQRLQRLSTIVNQGLASPSPNVSQLPTAFIILLVEQGFDPDKNFETFEKLKHVINDLQQGQRLRYGLFQHPSLDDEYKQNRDFELRKIRSDYAIQLIEKLLIIFFQQPLEVQAANYHAMCTATNLKQAGEFAIYWISSYPLMVYYKSFLVDAVNLRDRILGLNEEIVRQNFAFKQYTQLSKTDIEFYKIGSLSWIGLYQSEFWTLHSNWRATRQIFLPQIKEFSRTPNIFRKRNRGGRHSLYSRPTKLTQTYIAPDRSDDEDFPLSYYLNENALDTVN